MNKSSNSETEQQNVCNGCLTNLIAKLIEQNNQLIQQNTQVLQQSNQLIQINYEQSAQINELLMQLDDEGVETVRSNSLDG